MNKISLFETVITWRILKCIGKDWTEQKAYKLGIIDDKGNVLIKSKDLKTSEQKKAYTALEILAFNIKRLFWRFGLKSKLGSLLVAWKLLLQESKEDVTPNDGEMEELLDSLFEALSTTKKKYSSVDKEIMKTLIKIGQAVDDDVEDVLGAIDQVPGQSKQRKIDLLKSLKTMLKEEIAANSVGAPGGNLAGVNDGTVTKILGGKDLLRRKKKKKKDIPESPEGDETVTK